MAGEVGGDYLPFFKSSCLGVKVTGVLAVSFFRVSGDEVISLLLLAF